MLDWLLYIYMHNGSMKNTRNSFLQFFCLTFYMVSEQGFEFALEKANFMREFAEEQRRGEEP